MKTKTQNSTANNNNNKDILAHVTKRWFSVFSGALHKINNKYD